MLREIWEGLGLGRKERSWIILGLAFVAFVLFVISIFYATPVFFHFFMDNEAVKAGSSIGGSIGAFSNGVLVPFISSVAVVTTFLAFIVQYQANQRLTREAAEQRKDIQRERFETKFYELLRLHRTNLSEITIAGKYKGRKAFLKMFQELRFIYYTLWSILKNRKIEIPSAVQTEIAVTFFFFGTGHYSDPSVTRSLEFTKRISSPEIRNNIERAEGLLRKRLKDFQKEYENHHKRLISENKSILNHPFYREVWNNKGLLTYLETTFYPFDGHTEKLGHYYRHLYQTFKMVAKEPKSNVNFRAKYEYAKIVRAQLSNHEQALVYYNSFFIRGRAWWTMSDPSIVNDENFVLSLMLDYKIIKNVPQELTDFGLRPKEKYRQELFERWGEDKDRIDYELSSMFD